jgi:hypothetical protein
MTRLMLIAGIAGALVLVTLAAAGGETPRFAVYRVDLVAN